MISNHQDTIMYLISLNLVVTSYLAGDVPAWWTTSQGGSPTLYVTTCTGGGWLCHKLKSPNKFSLKVKARQLFVTK